MFKPPKAIRGGVPICFPQFSDFGPLGQHGFARNETWEVRRVNLIYPIRVHPPERSRPRPTPPAPRRGSDARRDRTSQVTARTPTSVQMTLRSTPASKEKWPHDFVCVYEVIVGAGNHLKTTMSVTNTGTEPMTFTTALHTYFRCDDALAAKVTGLKGASYLDSLDGRVRREEVGDFVAFAEEVDRIYLSTSDALAVEDVAGSRSIRITKRNLPDAVVWNPWIEKSKATGDLGDDDYKKFVCVEAAAIETPVTLPAGERWECEQVLECVKHASSVPAIDAAPSKVEAEEAR